MSRMTVGLQLSAVWKLTPNRWGSIHILMRAQLCRPLKQYRALSCPQNAKLSRWVWDTEVARRWKSTGLHSGHRVALNSVFSYMTDWVSKTSLKCSIIIETRNHILHFQHFSTERQSWRNVGGKKRLFSFILSYKNYVICHFSQK